MGQLHNHFMMFSDYNCWANARLFEAVAELSDEQFDKDCQVAFSSLNGTLNHLLVGDLIWLSRFEGKTHDDLPTKLDEVLYPKFPDLWQARQVLDDRIVRFIDGLNTRALKSDFSYTPITAPELMTQKLAPALAHFFNHQTHHRGQAHAMLTRLIGEAPPLDLIYYQRDLKLVSEEEG